MTVMAVVEQAQRRLRLVGWLEAITAGALVLAAAAAVAGLAWRAPLAGAARSRKYGNVTWIRALSAWRRPFRSCKIVGTVLMVTSPRWSFSTSTKRLMCVPLKWCGRLTDIESVATVCCC